MDKEQKEMYDVFAAESSEHIRKATDCILLIEESRDEEALNGLFRAFHTIKGNARMLGFPNIGELAHAAENVMARLRNGTLSPSKQVIDLLLSALDSIGVLIAEKAGGSGEPLHIGGLISSLDSVAKGEESPQNVKVKAKARAAERPVVMMKATGRQSSILVVEDDFLSRKTLLSMLAPYGTCDVAVNGKEAIEAFAAALDDRPYDLVCMDIMMPQVDGFEAVRQIRSAEMLAAIRKLKASGEKKEYHERKDAVVLMTSALDDPENYINACYRCGANAYLVKPILKDTLDSAMARFGLA